MASLLLCNLALAAGKAPTRKAEPEPEDRGPLPFARAGSGPSLVFLHGLGAGPEMWSEDVKRLSKNHTVVTIELPGHGTTAMGSGIDVAQIARDVAALIRKEQLAPAIVIGHSMGGTMAAHVGLADPKSVRAVVIIDSLIGRYPMGAAERTQLRQKLAVDAPKALREFYGRLSSSPEQAARLAAVAGTMDLTAFMAYLDWLSEHGVEQPRNLKMPVLLMAAPSLIDTPERRTERLGAAGFSGVPKLQVELFAKSNHWLMLDEPEHYASTLDAFLISVERKK
jgi:pimeloyl-ACP methyl ester carboxylesterase